MFVGLLADSGAHPAHKLVNCGRRVRVERLGAHLEEQLETLHAREHRLGEHVLSLVLQRIQAREITQRSLQKPQEKLFRKRKKT